MMIAYAKELRSKVPAALLGCQLLKVAINKLDRAKLTSVLKTAEAHSDIIVNLDEDQCSRMNYETASKNGLSWQPQWNGNVKTTCVSSVAKG